MKCTYKFNTKDGEQTIVGMAEMKAFLVLNGVDSIIGGVDIQMSKRAQVGTPEFKKWFGSSAVVNADGSPKLMYHGTAQDISSFKAKQAGAIFITDDPKFAEDFSEMSKQWMVHHYEEILTKDQADKALSIAEDQTRNEFKDDPEKADLLVHKMRMGEVLNPKVRSFFSKAIADQMPSGPNIMQVYVRAENPFDYENPSHVSAVVDELNKSMNAWGEPRGNKSKPYIESGNWEEIEKPTTQTAIKAAGFDGFYVKEARKKNLAVYSSTQIKSATGNIGTFDETNPDIRYSRLQPPLQGKNFFLEGETRTDAARIALQDYFLRVKQVQDAIAAQGGVVGEAQDVYLAEELSYGRLQEQLVDFKENMVKPLIKDVKAAGLELSDLALYSYAVHAPERNRQIASINKTFGKGEGSGMSTIEANNIIKAFEDDGKIDALKDLHNKLLSITQATRIVLFDEGLISKEEFDAWQGQYENYVPLRGFIEDEQDIVNGGVARVPRVGGKGFNIRGKESVRALGRTSKAGHIIENIVNDFERAIARAERNNVAKVFLDLATTNPDAGLWEIDTEKTKPSFNKAKDRVEYNKSIDKGEDTISAKLDGKEVYIKIKDPLLLRALRASSTDDTGQATRILAKTLGWYTALARNVLTRYNPAFGFTNAVKDLGFGAVSALDELGPKGMSLYFKHYTNPSQSGDIFEEFRAAGATTGGWHIKDTKELQKELERLIEWEGAGKVKAGAHKLGAGVLDALEFIGSYSETQARFAAYKAAREMGKSPAQAASIAKNLTTNFNRKGEWGSAMNSLYLFFNAGVQGSARMAKSLKNPYVQAAMAGLSGVAAGLAFLGAGMGGDDDDGEAYWDKIPQFEKERNLIIMLPPGKGMMIKGETKIGTNGRYIKIPIQYGLNVFTTLGYQMADLARHSKDKTRGVSPAKAAVNMTSVVFGAFNPFGGGFDVTNPAEVALAVAPSVGDLGVQALMGVNSFGKPVAPAKSPFDTKPDSENYGPSMAGTWEQRLAAWMNKKTGGDAAVSGAIDISPGAVRNIVRNVAGGTGDFLTSVFVNIPSKMWSPEGQVAPRDVPVLKAFYGEVDESVDINKYYERRAEIMKSADEAARRQKLGIVVEYDPETKGMQSLGNAAKQFGQGMTMLRKAELNIVSDKDLSDQQKDKQRKEIQEQRALLASQFNAAYYKMQKDVAAGKFGK